MRPLGSSLHRGETRGRFRMRGTNLETDPEQGTT